MMRFFSSARLAGVLLGSFLMFGCTTGQRLSVDSGLLSAQRVKDTEARVLKASVCAMSIGAYYRINREIERRALFILCGGLDGRPDLRL